MKDVLRRWLALALRWRARVSARPVALVIVYHALAERHGDPTRELVAPHGRTQFRAQLRHLSRHYRPVAPSEIREQAGRRRRGGRIPVAVTFDDDLHSHVAIAAPALDAAGGRAPLFFTRGPLHRAPPVLWGPAPRAGGRRLPP